MALMMRGTDNLYSSILAVAGMFSAVALAGVIYFRKEEIPAFGLIRVVMVGGGGASMILLLMGWVGNVRHRLLLSKLKNFDEYKKRVEEKWGKQRGT